MLGRAIRIVFPSVEACMGTKSLGETSFFEAVTRRSKRRLSRIAKGIDSTRCSKHAHVRIAKGDGLSSNVENDV